MRHLRYIRVLLMLSEAVRDRTTSLFDKKLTRKSRDNYGRLTGNSQCIKMLVLACIVNASYLWNSNSISYKWEFTKTPTYVYRLMDVRGPDSGHLYTAAYAWKPEQQRFTMQSGKMTSISSRQRSAIFGSPLDQCPNERTLDPRSAARQTQPGSQRHIWPSPRKCSPAMTLF